MLAGLEAGQRSAVPGFEYERSHILGLADLLDEPQGAHRLGIRVPSQGNGHGKLDDLLDVEGHQTPRAGNAGHRLRFPIDRGPAGKLQQTAGLEIDEQQTGSRVENEVADGVEVVVARVVGEHQAGLVRDRDEARVAPAVRGIHAERRVVAVAAVPGGNEEGIGRGDPVDLG